MRGSLWPCRDDVIGFEYTRSRTKKPLNIQKCISLDHQRETYKPQTISYPRNTSLFACCTKEGGKGKRVESQAIDNFDCVLWKGNGQSALRRTTFFWLDNDFLTKLQASIFTIIF